MNTIDSKTVYEEMALEAATATKGANKARSAEAHRYAAGKQLAASAAAFACGLGSERDNHEAIADKHIAASKGNGATVELKANDGSAANQEANIKEAGGPCDEKSKASVECPLCKHTFDVEDDITGGQNEEATCPSCKGVFKRESAGVALADAGAAGGKQGIEASNPEGINQWTGASGAMHPTQKAYVHAKAEHEAIKDRVNSEVSKLERPHEGAGEKAWLDHYTKAGEIEDKHGLWEAKDKLHKAENDMMDSAKTHLERQPVYKNASDSDKENLKKLWEKGPKSVNIRPKLVDSAFKLNHGDGVQASSSTATDALEATRAQSTAARKYQLAADEAGDASDNVLEAHKAAAGLHNIAKEHADMNGLEACSAMHAAKASEHKMALEACRGGLPSRMPAVAAAKDEGGKAGLEAGGPGSGPRKGGEKSNSEHVKEYTDATHTWEARNPISKEDHAKFAEIHEKASSLAHGNGAHDSGMVSHAIAKYHEARGESGMSHDKAAEFAQSHVMDKKK